MINEIYFIVGKGKEVGKKIDSELLFWVFSLFRKFLLLLRLLISVFWVFVEGEIVFEIF